MLEACQGEFGAMGGEVEGHFGSLGISWGMQQELHARSTRRSAMNLTAQVAGAQICR